MQHPLNEPQHRAEWGSKASWSTHPASWHAPYPGREPVQENWGSNLHTDDVEHPGDHRDV